MKLEFILSLREIFTLAISSGNTFIIALGENIIIFRVRAHFKKFGE